MGGQSNRFHEIRKQISTRFRDETISAT